MLTIVGRGHEQSRLQALVSEGGALALVGEPGIGKTVLLEYARTLAPAIVLRATGTEAERDLPFAALLTLLRPVLHLLDRLPQVQARALEGALALGPPARADRLVVHAAALGLLCAAADRQTVLTTVDDAHWLDHASADALLFAARRLEGERVALLLALRPGERQPQLEGIEQLPLDGLAHDEAVALLRDVPATVVTRLHRATAGNPLALLEALGHLPAEQLTGRDPLGDPLLLGPGVQAGFRRRLDRLPDRTRTALLLVAAAGAEQLCRVAAAGADLGVTLTDLDPAERDHLIEAGVDEVHFRHPLVRAAAYRDAPAPELRAAHRALAAHTTGPRRASHLWAAASGLDGEAADALEAAAGEARSRTGFSAAALAMERAARLTPPGDARALRLLAAANDRVMGGDATRAFALARQARSEASDSLVCAEVDGLLGSLDMLAGSLDSGFEQLIAAAEVIAAADPERAAWMLSSAAVSCFMAGRGPRGLATGRRAYELSRRVGGRTELCVGLLLASWRVISGGELDEGERALLDRWPEALDERILIPGAPHLIGQLPFRAWLEDFDEAEAFAARVDEMVAATGAVGALPLLRSGQLEIDLRRGDWAQARARGAEALRISVETGQSVSSVLPLAILARLDAAMGNEQECREAVREARRLAQAAGIGSLNVYAAAAVGLLELGLGHAERAAGHLDEAARLCREYGQLDPSVVEFHPDRIEAHVRAGNLARAREALAEFEAMAERTQRQWPLACAARAHGMLEDDFEPWFDRAYTHHVSANSPFEVGRTELCHGERLRRARRVREARGRLRSALEHFENLGAAPWAARARTELRAAGGAALPERAAVTRELTPQELEVALAVAGGATNREIAAALFVSPKTVEVHLTRIFKKLGIRSRTQLATLFVRS